MNGTSLTFSVGASHAFMQRTTTCQCRGAFRRMRRTFIAKSFNHAYASHAGEEARAHRVAWAAVKRSYVKVGDSWVARSVDYVG